MADDLPTRAVPLRLLIVSQYFWPEMFRVNDLVSELIARGHSVTILTGKPNYPDGKVFPAFRADPSAFDRFEGARVYRVPMLARGSGSIRLALNYLTFALAALLLAPFKLRGQRFDAIFVFQTSPITAAIPALLMRRLKRAPVLMWVLDLWPDTLAAIGVIRSPRLLGMVGWLVRFIYNGCDRILIQSRAFHDRVAAYADRAKIRYFPGWAEAVFADGDCPAASAPELAPYTRDFRIVFAGNIGEAQDFPAILAAAQLLRDVPALRWVIVGDGRAAAEVRRNVSARGLDDRVVFLGRFPLDRMPSFFAGADALLVSLRDEPIWNMTIPGKVQSYLAAGRPLLGMLNGEGARVIEEARAGFASPASDAVALAENVRRLMALTPAARAAMGERGRAYCAREFGRSGLIDQFTGWVDELVTPAPAR